MTHTLVEITEHKLSRNKFYCWHLCKKKKKNYMSSKYKPFPKKKPPLSPPPLQFTDLQCSLDGIDLQCQDWSLMSYFKKLLHLKLLSNFYQYFSQFLRFLTNKSTFIPKYVWNAINKIFHNSERSSTPFSKRKTIKFRKIYLNCQKFS